MRARAFRARAVEATLLAGCRRPLLLQELSWPWGLIERQRGILALAPVATYR